VPINTDTAPATIVHGDAAVHGVLWVMATESIDPVIDATPLRPWAFKKTVATVTRPDAVLVELLPMINTWFGGSLTVQVNTPLQPLPTLHRFPEVGT
jgi:hypothetical protein